MLKVKKIIINKFISQSVNTLINSKFVFALYFPFYFHPVTFHAWFLISLYYLHLARARAVQIVFQIVSKTVSQFCYHFRFRCFYHKVICYLFTSRGISVKKPVQVF